MQAASRILVCDDDELLVDLLEYRLSARGFEVIVARDGLQAVAMADGQKPDAIILDMMMPGLDGNRVLNHLRSNDATAKIPVVMLTARKNEQDIVGALELGANDYLVKPFIPEELITRLSRLLDKGQ